MICHFLSVRESESLESELLNLLHARTESGMQHDAESKVRQILADVRTQGDAALLDYTQRFDAPDAHMPLRVPESALKQALAELDRTDKDSIRRAAENIRKFHEAQKEESWFLSKTDDTILGQKITAVARAGLYVPGGRGGNTPLLSSLLMTAIPAKVAGVQSLAIMSPPRRDGTLNSVLLATAAILDLHEVYAAGGAWAIAALAYGTETIQPVDVIAGPGNIWITTAKRLLQGHTGIDMIAGPSEVLILADSSASADWIAADMLAQAEHDPLAAAICLTDDAALAEAVCRELEKQLPDLPRVEIAGKSLADWGAVCAVQNMQQAIALANRIAPEHLEIMTSSPWEILPQIQNAGAIFLGKYSPEPLGDYFAGPDHVLPTLGTARFSSGISVQTFCKRSSIIAAGREFTAQSVDAVARLARLEHLEAHARSAEKRRKE